MSQTDVIEDDKHSEDFPISSAQIQTRFPPSQVFIAGLVLPIIACAARALDVEELQALLVIKLIGYLKSNPQEQLDKRDEAFVERLSIRSIKELLDPYVKITNDHKILRGESILCKNEMDYMAAALDLARLCMECLLSDSENATSSPSTFQQEHIVSLSEATTRTFAEHHHHHHHRLLDYASASWFIHLAECNDIATTEDHDNAIKLLNIDWLGQPEVERETQSYDAPENPNPLFLGTHFHLHSTVQRFLDRQVEPGPLLHEACRTGRVVCVERLLQHKNTNVNWLDAKSRTPLLSLLQDTAGCSDSSAHTVIVDLLIQYGADLSASSDGRNALSWACGHRNHAILERLIRACPEKVNEPDSQGYTPLEWTVNGPHYRKHARLLLEQGFADVNRQHALGCDGPGCQRKGGHDDPHHYREGHSDSCRLYGCHGDGRSILSLAMTWESGLGTLDLLLGQQCIDLDSEDRNKYTALSWAAYAGDLKRVKRLTQKAIKIDHQNNLGRTPLSIAALKGHHEVLEHLIMIGANPYVLDLERRCPLSHAASGGHTSAFKTLLASHRKLEGVGSLSSCSNCTDIKGWTPFYHAIYNGHLEIVKLLVKEGLGRNPRMSSGGMPCLSFAASRGHDPVVELLLDDHCVGANPDLVDPGDGSTPLTHAIRNQQEKVVRQLLHHGADPAGHGLEQKDISPKIQKLLDRCLKSRVPKEARSNRLVSPPIWEDVINLGAEVEATIVYEFELQLASTKHTTYPVFKHNLRDLVLGEGLKEIEVIGRNIALQQLKKPWVRGRIRVDDLTLKSFCINLPSHEETWILALVRRLCSLHGKNERQHGEIIDFIERSLNEYTCGPAKSFSRKPVVRVNADSDKSNMVALLMPILELECPTCFEKGARLPHHRSDARTLEQSFYGKELKVHGSPRVEAHGQDDDRRFDNGQLLQRIYRYISRTCSASRLRIDGIDHYNAWNDPRSTEHDDKQAKHVRPHFQDSYVKDVEHGFLCGSRNPNQAPDSGKIITVNHFWLWMLEMNDTGAKTIITATPEVLAHQRSFESIDRKLLNPDQPENLPRSLLPGLIQQRLNQATAYSQYDPLDKLTQAIVEKSSQIERLHAEFVCLVQSRSSDGLQLVHDATLYKEVKDIQEELNMLRPVYNTQAEAIKMLRAACDEDTTIIDPESLINVQQGCDDRLKRLTRLQNFARETSESLQHLLDLKQKQASLNIAIWTKREAQSAELQNVITFVFTTATVVFAPLSFMTAYYALDISQFPHSDGGTSFQSFWVTQRLATAVLATLGAVTFATWIYIRARTVFLS